MNFKVLDNHVIDYVPPEVILAKSSNPQLRNRTKDGLLGMAIVGALSSDPRLVIFFISNLELWVRKFNAKFFC